MGKDIYGIPEGGNNGAWAAHKWKNINYTLPWSELVASIALGGWPQELWATAAAVAAAESGRNPFIYNTYKLGHFGLFQISRSAHKDFFDKSGDGQFRWVGPWSNAKKAYEIYKSEGWGAWEGKTNGSYLVYLPEAKVAAKKLKDKTLVHPHDEKGFWNSQISQKTFGYVLKAMDVSAADIANAANETLGGAVEGAASATAQGVLDAGSALVSSMRENFGWMNDFWTSFTTPAIWMRLAYGATGVILVAGGLFLIVSKSQTAKSAASVIPQGKALKAVKGAA